MGAEDKTVKLERCECCGGVDGKHNLSNCPQKRINGAVEGIAKLNEGENPSLRRQYELMLEQARADKKAMLDSRARHALRQ